jgi:hypothetical protein
MRFTGKNMGFVFSSDGVFGNHKTFEGQPEFSVGTAVPRKRYPYRDRFDCWSRSGQLLSVSLTIAEGLDSNAFVRLDGVLRSMLRFCLYRETSRCNLELQFRTL